jgi:hypothetical protein
MSSNTYQVAGTHYVSKDIQPWEVIERNAMGFFDGNALKYLMRYKEKGGVDDLRKAKHYIEKLIELELVVKEKAQEALKEVYADKVTSKAEAVSVFAKYKDFSVCQNTIDRTKK